MSYGSIPYAWRPPLNIRARLKLSSWQIPTGGPLAHLWIPLRFREAAQYLVLTSDLLTVGGVVVGGGVHAPLCPINQNGTAKISKPQKTKSISIWCCNNTMWCICQDSELATAINYQWGVFRALNIPDGWSFYLCARYHNKALRSLMTQLTYTLGSGDRVSSSCGHRHVCLPKVRKNTNLAHRYLATACQNS